MDYQESTEYLYRQLPMFSRVGAAAYKPGLDTIIKLDNFFGNPHNKFKSIHIGGTNGKGSTSHLLASVLQVQGYKVGLYTSPHLTDFRERIRINGEMIPKHSVTEFVNNYLSSGYTGKPSFFELTMMLAFYCFAKEKVDYAIIEVGMGGRLDSTNIITPEACVITNISKDHTGFLGDTLEKIAYEKAGIIKSGVPVTIGEAKGNVRKVFEEKAKEVRAKIYFAEDIKPLQKAVHTSEGWNCITNNYGEIFCSLKGDYQSKNINTALAAIEMLKLTGIEISDESIKCGFRNVEKNTGLRGRWTRLGKDPEIICDTGHNEAGIKSNIHQLLELQKTRNGKLLIVIGFVADKAIDDILRLLPKDAIYFLTNANIPRALPVEILEEKFKSIGGMTFSSYKNVPEAYKAANIMAEPDDIIFVGGSTFIVADLLGKLEKQNIQ